LECGGRTEEKCGAVDKRHGIVDEGKKFGGFLGIPLEAVVQLDWV
jgi:hypothetical protein